MIMTKIDLGEVLGTSKLVKKIDCQYKGENTCS